RCDTRHVREFQRVEEEQPRRRSRSAGEEDEEARPGVDRRYSRPAARGGDEAGQQHRHDDAPDGGSEVRLDLPQSGFGENPDEGGADRRQQRVDEPALIAHPPIMAGCRWAVTTWRTTTPCRPAKPSWSGATSYHRID